jgi:WD40 repeat protein
MTDARFAAERVLNMWDWGNSPGLLASNHDWREALTNLLDRTGEVAQSGVLLRSGVQALRFGLLRSMALGTTATPAPAAAASVDGDKIAFISRDAGFYRWEPERAPANGGQNPSLEANLAQPPLRHSLNLTHFAISPDGRLALAAGERGMLSSFAIDARGPRFNPPVRLDDFPLSGVSFSADGKLIGVGSSSGWWQILPRGKGEQPNGVFVQKLLRIGAGIKLTFALLFNRVPQHYPVQSFAISAQPAGAGREDVLVGTLNEWRTGKLWNGRRRKITKEDRDFSSIVVQVPHPRLPVFAEAYRVEKPEMFVTNPLASVDSPKAPCIRIRTRETAKSLIVPKLEYLENLTALAWSEDGTRLAVGTDHGNVVFLRFDEKTMQLQTDTRPPIPAHRASITVLRWNKDGTRLMTAAEDSRLVWWNVAPDLELNRLIGQLSEFEAHFPPNADTIDAKDVDWRGLIQAVRSRVH